jgi:hypothetical protein
MSIKRLRPASLSVDGVDARVASGTNTSPRLYDAGGTAGWRVLALLQFIAAGSFVFAFASHVFFSQGLRAVLKRSPQTTALRTYRAIYRRTRSPSRPSQTPLSKARARTAIKAPRLPARVAWFASLLIRYAALGAVAARAPPA